MKLTALETKEGVNVEQIQLRKADLERWALNYGNGLADAIVLDCERGVVTFSNAKYRCLVSELMKQAHKIKTENADTKNTDMNAGCRVPVFGRILAGASDGLVGSVDVAKRELLLECGLTTVGAVVAVRGKLGIIVLFKTGRESEWKDVGHGPYMLRGGCGEISRHWIMDLDASKKY